MRSRYWAETSTGCSAAAEIFHMQLTNFLDETMRPDLDLLQGVWTITALEVEGQEMPAA